MKVLAALLLVLLVSALRYVYARRSGLVILVAGAGGVWYSLRLDNSTAGAILVCYFLLELGKGLGKRGGN